MIDAFLGWAFGRRTPLSTGQRVDLELLTRRTIEVFGIGWLKDRAICRKDYPKVAVDVVETPSVDHSEADLHSLIDDAAKQLGLSQHIVGDDAERLDCKLVPSEEFQQMFRYQPAQNGSPAVLEIPQHVMGDPLRSAVTVATGMSRHAWEHLGTRDLDRDVRMASLMPILGGMGPMVANAALYDTQWTAVGFSNWTLSRMGQFNAMEVGFAMALAERIKGNHDNGWTKELREDARVTAIQAINYFDSRDAKSLPMLVDANSIPSDSRDPHEFTRWIIGESEEFALSAMRVLNHRWTTEKTKISSADVAAAILKASDSDDLYLQAAATELIGHCDLPQDLIVDVLIKRSKHKHPTVALAALESAAKHNLSPTPFVPAAQSLLQSESFDLLPVLRWVGGAGDACQSLIPLLCLHLHEALKWENESGVKATADALARVSSDAVADCKRHIKDAEICSRAVEQVQSINA